MLLRILIGLFYDAAIKNSKKCIQGISRGHIKIDDVIILQIESIRCQKETETHNLFKYPPEILFKETIEHVSYFNIMYVLNYLHSNSLIFVQVTLKRLCMMKSIEKFKIIKYHHVLVLCQKYEKYKCQKYEGR